MGINDFDILGLIERNGPLKSEVIDFDSLFLPSLSKVYKLFGNNINFESTVKLIEKQSNINLSLSQSTKRNVETKGVGLSSTKKTLSWIQSLPDSTNALICKKVEFGLLRRIAVNSNSAQWLPFLQVFESFNTIPPDIISPALNFLKDRCDHDYQSLCSARIQIKTGKVDIHCQQSLWSLQQQLWEGSSPVTGEQLNAIHQQNSNLGPDPIVRGWLCMEYDFYLQLVAFIEIGTKKWINDHSYISPALRAYAQSKELALSTACCFGGLLYALKDELHEHDSNKMENKDSGWRKLASFIEINDAGSSEPSLDRQYTQLKHWRSGKDTPSKSNFEKFTKNYLEYIQKPNDMKLAFSFAIVMMLDNLENEILDRNKREHPDLDPIHLKEQIQKVLYDYPRYYEVCLGRVLQQAQD